MLLNAPEIELPASKEIDMREICLAFQARLILVVEEPSGGRRQERCLAPLSGDSNALLPARSDAHTSLTGTRKMNMRTVVLGRRKPVTRARCRWMHLIS